MGLSENEIAGFSSASSSRVSGADLGLSSTSTQVSHAKQRSNHNCKLIAGSKQKRTGATDANQDDRGKHSSGRTSLVRGSGISSRKPTLSKQSVSMPTKKGGGILDEKVNFRIGYKLSGTRKGSSSLPGTKGKVEASKTNVKAAMNNRKPTYDKHRIIGASSHPELLEIERTGRETGKKIITSIPKKSSANSLSSAARLRKKAGGGGVTVGTIDLPWLDH